MEIVGLKKRMVYEILEYRGYRIAQIVDPFSDRDQYKYIWLTKAEPGRVFFTEREVQGCLDSYVKEKEYFEKEEEAL